jgi:multidrug resistance protein
MSNITSRTLKRLPWRPYVTPVETILAQEYGGEGSDADPHLIDWLLEDNENPLTWSPAFQWCQLALVSFAMLSVTAGSSAYTGGIPNLVNQFNISDEVALLGVSLYVLGFGAGPLIWSPLSDVYGRRTMYLFSIGMLTLWNAVTAASQNATSVLIFRFLAGFFGGAPLSSGAATIADVFPPKKRGIAVSFLFATAFVGPAIGPICGGFLGQNAGWRWVEGFLSLFTGSASIALGLFCAETCAPVLLRRRAVVLSHATGNVYKYRGDANGTLSTRTIVVRALISPWKFLLEPIVILLTLYISIIYGIVYLDFAAFPIVFEELRGWNRGESGLGFLGIVVGVISSIIFNIFVINPHFMARVQARGGVMIPEDRLIAAIIGGIASLFGLVGFAATDDPDTHYVASILFGIPFGFGVVLIFMAVIGYLVDAYTVYAAPVLATNAFVRAAFAAGFPLFTSPMYQRLGVHWAAAVPAFLILACLPPTFLLFKYGARIRARGKWAARAEEKMKEIMASRQEEVISSRMLKDEETGVQFSDKTGSSSSVSP